MDIDGLRTSSTSPGQTSLGGNTVVTMHAHSQVGGPDGANPMEVSNQAS